MTLPNRHLVGAPKAGTTTVAGRLSEHPDVSWSVPKLRAHDGLESRSAYEVRYSSEPDSSGTAWRARYRTDGSTTDLSSDRAVPDVHAAVPAARFQSDLARTRHRRLVPSIKADTDILSGILDD